MTRRGQLNLTVIAAFLIAALTPAIIVSVAVHNWGGIVWQYFSSLFLVMLFGTPAFAILASRSCVNFYSSILGAAAAALLPVALMVALSWSNWLDAVAFAGTTVGLGASAGLTFWLVLKLSGNLSAANGDYDPESMVKPFAAMAVLVTAGVLVGAACSLQWLLRGSSLSLQDRSCHNVFRDGATSVPAVISMELDVSLPDWPKLRALFARFGAAHRLSLKDDSMSQPGTVDALAIDICNDQGTNISANWQVWTGQPPVAGLTGTPIGIYQVRNDAHWKDIARDFIAEMNAAWPGKLVFLDRKGNRSAELPAILAPSSPAPPSKPAGK